MPFVFQEYIWIDYYHISNSTISPKNIIEHHIKYISVQDLQLSSSKKKNNLALFQYPKNTWEYGLRATEQNMFRCTALQVNIAKQWDASCNNLKCIAYLLYVRHFLQINPFQMKIITSKAHLSHHNDGNTSKSAWKKSSCFQLVR